ncbi:shikimate kinase [Petrocella sp. FN5]|uniref:shikimate kinase n=1 Tax=Petrocella sp. FN5 TaxID=3032002 RepID=UPI0023D9EB84|nr:shikimate kinase [Petrocella sp. FN5]MDF1617021.1 shikimate kinase [Petrocella sp. FN5]
MSDGNKGENIVLIGFMGCGKTSVTKELAKRLNLNYIDMDEKIEKAEGKTVSEIFKDHGEAYFRDLETTFLSKLENQKSKIISTGGGIILRDENIEMVKKIGIVVFLQADVAHILKNIKDDHKRPLLQDEEDIEKKITTMLELREPLYLRTANVIIQTSGKPIKNIVDEILEIL